MVSGIFNTPVRAFGDKSVKVRYEFFSVIEFRGEDPRSFFISTFVTFPSYKIEELACFMPSVDFGV